MAYRVRLGPVPWFPLARGATSAVAIYVPAALSLPAYLSPAAKTSAMLQTTGVVMAVWAAWELNVMWQSPYRRFRSVSNDARMGHAALRAAQWDEAARHCARAARTICRTDQHRQLLKEFTLGAVAADLSAGHFAHAIALVHEAGAYLDASARYFIWTESATREQLHNLEAVLRVAADPTAREQLGDYPDTTTPQAKKFRRWYRDVRSQTVKTLLDDYLQPFVLRLAHVDTDAPDCPAALRTVIDGQQ